MDEMNRIMTVSSTNSSEDSGYDNGFLSDSSTSSSSLDCCRQVCLFSKSNKTKSNSKRSHHKCALNSYDISGNSIETISSRTLLYISHCVKKLDLSKNKISSVPESICQLKSLEELNLSHNDLYSVPESWKVLHKLKVLKLSGNNLSVPPQCLVFGMESLTHIDLSCNKISKFVNPPLCLPVLQHLNLSKNCFLSLPLWLFSEQCRSLVELDMSLNFCFDDNTVNEQLPVLKHHRTSALKSLQKLNISNTGAKFERLTYLSHFESLQYLYMGNVVDQQLTYNCFWKFYISLFSNPLCIIELHLSSVGLAGLPEDIYKLKNLRVLILSDNTLDWLPDCFGMLSSLEELVMSNCNLAYLPENFNQLSCLKKLQLDHNKLTDVGKQLAGLMSLKCLDLYDNNLEEFPLSHNHLLTLEKLDVAANYVNLEVALDFKMFGESLLDIYSRLQANLRNTDVMRASRQDGCKNFSNLSSWDSNESFHKSYRNDEGDSESNTDCNEENVCINVEEEEENWDDDSSCSDDYFDPNGVKRYYLPPGSFKFGWTPPIRQRHCVIPTALLLSNFVYIPGQGHTKTTRRRKMNIKTLPTVDGQFNNDHVDDTSALQGQEALFDFLKHLHIFIRNSHGPKDTRCRICSIYDDCWHIGFWFRF